LLRKRGNTRKEHAWAENTPVSLDMPAGGDESELAAVHNIPSSSPETYANFSGNEMFGTGDDPFEANYDNPRFVAFVMSKARKMLRDKRNNLLAKKRAGTLSISEKRELKYIINISRKLNDIAHNAQQQGGQMDPRIVQLFQKWVWDLYGMDAAKTDTEDPAKAAARTPTTSYADKTQTELEMLDGQGTEVTIGEYTGAGIYYNHDHSFQWNINPVNTADERVAALIRTGDFNHVSGRRKGE
jgi:hypothetical protein